MSKKKNKKRTIKVKVRVGKKPDQPKVDPTKLEWPKEPLKRETELSTLLEWTSACKRYRVSEVRGKLNGTVQYAAERHLIKDEVGPKSGWTCVQHDKSLGRGYYQYFSSLAKAMDICAEHLRSTLGVDSVKSNSEEIAPVHKAPAPTPKSGGKSQRSGSGGDNNAKVLSVLGKTPMSFAEIVTATGLTRGQVRYAFLTAQVKAGVLAKDGKGWKKVK